MIQKYQIFKTIDLIIIHLHFKKLVNEIIITHELKAKTCVNESSCQNKFVCYSREPMGRGSICGSLSFLMGCAV